MERLTEWCDGKAIPRMDLRKNGHDKCMNKLAHYEDFEEQGRLIKLPCRFGTKAYKVYMACPSLWKAEYCDDHEGSCDNCPHRVPKIVSTIFSAYDIGRNIFLTKAEAEAKLKEMEVRNE